MTSNIPTVEALETRRTHWNKMVEDVRFLATLLRDGQLTTAIQGLNTCEILIANDAAMDRTIMQIRLQGNWNPTNQDPIQDHILEVCHQALNQYQRNPEKLPDIIQKITTVTDSCDQYPVQSNHSQKLDRLTARLQKLATSSDSPHASTIISGAHAMQLWEQQGGEPELPQPPTAHAETVKASDSDKAHRGKSEQRKLF